MANEERRPPLQEYVEARLGDIKDEIRRELDLRFAGSDRFHEAALDALEKNLRDIIAEGITRGVQRFDAQEQALATAFRRADEALAEAKATSLLGFQKSNEWQGTFRDMSQTYMTRATFDSEHKALNTMVALVSDRVGKIENMKGGAGESWDQIMRIVPILISLAAVLLVVWHR